MADQFVAPEEVEFYFIAYAHSGQPGQYHASRLGAFSLPSLHDLRSQRRKSREVHFNLSGWWLAPCEERLSTREREAQQRLERVIQSNELIAVIDGSLMCERHAERARDMLNQLLGEALQRTGHP
jgi:hypothetical protein